MSETKFSCEYVLCESDVLQQNRSAINTLQKFAQLKKY